MNECREITQEHVPLELLESGIQELEEIDPIEDFPTFLTRWGRWFTEAIRIGRCISNGKKHSKSPDR